MKRKLVEYEVFRKMNENSLTAAIKELIEAEEYLARALNVEEVKLKSFNETTVIYETNQNYIRANFNVGNNKVVFENVEELVIDENSKKEEARNILRNMLEAILDDNEIESNKFFDKYIKLQSDNYAREANEVSESVIVEEAAVRIYGSPERTKGKSTPKISRRTGSKDPVKVRAALKAHARHKGSYAKGARKRHNNVNQERRRRSKYKVLHSRLRSLSGGKQYTGKRKVNEWFSLSNNVCGYLDFVENGHVLTESTVVDGNLTITMPDSKTRNEGKILKMHFDNMLKTDVKVLREAARRLAHDQVFCHMVADVKRHNNLSDDKGLEESITNLVTKFPSILYLTQEELAKTIATSLDSINVTNYDDQTCRFMSEGILRMAHEAYEDRVQRIKKLANKEIQESDDKYLDFQNVIADFFPTLDESTQLEMKMFEDLYEAAIDIRKIALDSNNDVVRTEASEFITELEAILNGQAIPSLELAADMADWLETLAEGNLPGAGETMDVVKTPHHTTTGDHPQMAKNAKVPGHPGGSSDDWGDPAPMIGQDSMARNHGDEARNRSWGNKGGKDVWPDLTNPVQPKAGEFKIKGEKSPEDDEGFGDHQADCWPDLVNPYLLKSVMPKQKVGDPVE